MFLSAVIHLKALEKGSIPQHAGSALRAEFLRWVAERDARRAEELHDGDGRRPYTVSELHGTFHAKDGFNQFERGASAWFRVTCLRAEESTLLLNTLLPRLKGREFSLLGSRFEVQEGATGGHPWARVEAAQSLVDRHFDPESPAPDFFDVEFVSPTAFSDDAGFVPLPIPENVFGSWLRRWDAFAAASLPRAVPALGEARLTLNRFDGLRTSPVQLPEGMVIGFSGACRFRTLAEDDFWARLCNLLADFSFFCGTGAKTTVGLGQTRRLA